VVCIVPALLVTGGLIADSYRRARDSAERDALATTRALLQAVDGALLGAQSSLQVLAGSPHLRSGDIAAFHAAASEALKSLPGNGIVLVDSEGQQRMSTLVPIGRPLPKTGVPNLVRAIFESARPGVSDFYMGATSRQPSRSSIAAGRSWAAPGPRISTSAGKARRNSSA
jgi:hypothetical protein